MIGGVTYQEITNQGLQILIGNENHFLEVDNIIICAGQDSLHNLYDDLHKAGVNTHLIGGAAEAIELDAERAIEQGTKLAINF